MNLVIGNHKFEIDIYRSDWSHCKLCKKTKTDPIHKLSLQQIKQEEDEWLKSMREEEEREIKERADMGDADYELRRDSYYWRGMSIEEKIETLYDYLIKKIEEK